MQIKSEEQLEKYLMTRLKKALSRTLDRCLNELQDIIQRDVYDTYYGSWAEAGFRTNQFKDSFVKRRLKTSKNEIMGTIDQNLSKMPIKRFTNKDYGIHYPDRKMLAQIIETGIGYNFGYAPARPYWTNFKLWMNRNVYTIFKEECAKLGVNGVFTNLQGASFVW